MAKLQRSANTVDTLVLEGGRHLKRLIVVFQVHFLGAKKYLCVRKFRIQQKLNF